MVGLVFTRVGPMLAVLGAVCLARADAGLDLILLNEQSLGNARQRVLAGDPSLQPAYKRLLGEAEEALKSGPWSVTAKSLVPPSGDKHDYLSFGPYWWPNPRTKDGLPYVRRDGEVNPETLGGKSDRVNMGRFSETVQVLALAYFFTGEERFATHAARLLRTWHLDPATRMNPHLNFGQAIPGITEGRGIGIIDTTLLLPIPDATLLLQNSQSWTASDMQAMKDWFAHYLDWLLTSKHGRDEAAAANNHGTYYDIQVATFALYVGRTNVARQTLQNVGMKRLSPQLKPDGSQPHELARTKSLSYSAMNLRGLLKLGLLGRRLNVDVLYYSGPEGQSLRKATDFLLAYTDPAKKWPHPQISSYDPQQLYGEAVLAACLFEDKRLLELADRICTGPQRAERIRLEWNR